MTNYLFPKPFLGHIVSVNGNAPFGVAYDFVDYIVAVDLTGRHYIYGKRHDIRYVMVRLDTQRTLIDLVWKHRNDDHE